MLLKGVLILGRNTCRGTQMSEMTSGMMLDKKDFVYHTAWCSAYDSLLVSCGCHDPIIVMIIVTVCQLLLGTH